MRNLRIAFRHLSKMTTVTGIITDVFEFDGLRCIEGKEKGGEGRRRERKGKKGKEKGRGNVCGSKWFY